MFILFLEFYFQKPLNLSFYRPVEKFSSIGDESLFRKLNNSQKQILFLEMEKEKYNSNFAVRQHKERMEQANEKKEQAKKLAEKAEKMNDKIAKTSSLKRNVFKGETDFFGRSTSNKSNNNFTSSKSSPKYSKYSKHSVFFKFQEGYSNAVRRTAYVKDFL